MTPHERAVDALSGAGVKNVGKVLLHLDRAGLVIVDSGDAHRLAIVSAERDDYAHSLRQAAEGEWALARHLMRAEPYKRIMSRFDASREAEWIKQARTKGAA